MMVALTGELANGQKLGYQVTDLFTERLVGSYQYGEKVTPFDMPVISHIVDNLYLGGFHSELYLPNNIQTVVSLYADERYKTISNLEHHEIQMEDAYYIDTEALKKARDLVLAGLEKGPTLVHCYMGLNRSGMVSAYTLMSQGFSAGDAISLLRDKRSPAVLCNEAFHDWLYHNG